MEMKVGNFWQGFCCLCSGSSQSGVKTYRFCQARPVAVVKIKGPRLGNEFNSERSAVVQGMVTFTPASPLRLFVTRQVMTLPS